MPVGGGGKPAGGYRAGKKGSYGCKGYPTVSADGTVHGCHPTKAAAASQARAIWASVNSQKADSLPLEAFMEKAYRVAENVEGCDGFAVIDEDGMLDRCFDTRQAAEAYANSENMVDTDEMSEDMSKKSIFANFGKDWTKSTRITELGKRERSTATRQRLAEGGAAMPDGSYPIVTVEDLRNAIQAFGRTDNPQATKEHIMRRARALGRTDLIPENWK